MGHQILDKMMLVIYIKLNWNLLKSISANINIKGRRSSPDGKRKRASQIDVVLRAKTTSKGV